MPRAPNVFARIVSAILIGVHVGLGIWALAGFAEFFSSDVPWPRLSNPLFPDHILLAQWSAVLVCSLVFVIGYLTRRRWLPIAMAAIYAVMAGICAAETFGYLIHDGRFLAMGAEYVIYVAILLFLFRTWRSRILT